MVVVGAGEGRPEAVDLGELLPGAEGSEALDGPSKPCQSGALRHERVGDDGGQIGVLGGLEDPVGDLDGPTIVGAQEVGPGELAAEGDDRGVGGEVGELGCGRLEERERLGGPTR